MKLLRESLICAVLLALSALITVGAFVAWQVPYIVAQQADFTRKALVSEITETREALVFTQSRDLETILKRVDSIASKADSQITALRRDTLRVTDQHLTAIEMASAVTLDGLTGRVTALQGSVDALVKPSVLLLDTYRAAGDQFNQALPLFLDCEYNPDCVFNRYVGVAKSVEKTAQVIAGEAPHMTEHADAVAASAAQVAASVQREADVLTRPQAKAAAMRSWALVLARIWGAL